MSQKIATFIYNISTIFNCRCGKCTTKLQQNNLLGEGGIYMKEIVIKRNGESIRLTEEDIIHLWEVVVDLIGEEI